MMLHLVLMIPASVHTNSLFKRSFYLLVSLQHTYLQLQHFDYAHMDSESLVVLHAAKKL